ncbi:lamin tail domain-containing protein 2 [Manis pentadactyla]|uniref:lamin tail domain-containing protein 2 n=1 Tax=Manis pentadactyla TaxID=143292 RepID=UPI00255C4980|nr:lamin tail domain-containing protein 2 [Manis pentadactyla]
MSPEPHQEALSSLVDQEPVSGHLGPPAGTPEDPVAPECPQDIKASSTRVVFSDNRRSVPESLDPCTLRLLWRQRELEIQALRWAIQNRQDARHCHILQEVAGLPPERSSHSQKKVLQHQVQKLTLELKEQKEKAQLEKAQLEERLLQTLNTLQQLEAELQAFQKSCLLQLARSSWVGRMLRSSTGSVEVVTAETLMDSSDVSENGQGSTAGEGFRLEDVDWNSIAHRYPNLFTKIKSNADQKHPLPPKAPMPGEWGSKLHRRHMKQSLKSVEWSSLPLGTSSSGGSDSNSSSCQLTNPYTVQRVTGHPPSPPSLTSSEKTEVLAGSLSKDAQAEPEGLCRAAPVSQMSQWTLHMQAPSWTGLLSLDPRKTHSDWGGKAVQAPKACADPEHWHPGHCWSPTSSCLKIVAVSRRGRFVRILNQSPEDTAELSGLVLKQLVRGFPERMYRFPPGTRLGPRQLLTVRPAPPPRPPVSSPDAPRPSLSRLPLPPQVWGEGRCSSQKPPPSSLGQEPVRFHSSPGCVTLLLNPKGETLSEHQAPQTLSEHQAPCSVAPASRLCSDDTDLSTDRFPLSEAQSQADSSEQLHRPRPPRAGRLREARAGRRRLRTRGLLPRLTTGEHLLPREGPARPEGADTDPAERLPTVPGARMPARGGRGGPAGSGQLARPAPTPPRSHAEAAQSLRDGQAGNEPRVRVCRRSVDRCCPMVALSVQSTAESRFGFRFLSCPPITADARWQV